MQAFHKRIRLLALLMATLLLLPACKGEESTPSKQPDSTPRLTDAYVDYLLEQDVLSCLVGGQALSEREVTRNVSEKTSDVARVITVERVDKATGLVFTTTLTHYLGHDALEIAGSIRNSGNERSPVISELYAADVSIPVPGSDGITLKTARGCLTTGIDDDYDFAEVTYDIGVGSRLSFAPQGGRSCNGAWPYFDLVGKDGGAVLALGWTGQWQASFETVPGGIRCKAGQQYFNAFLYPDETVTTPFLTVLLYEGDSEKGRNDFRQLYLERYTPENVKKDDFVWPISFNFPSPFAADTAIPWVQDYADQGYKNLCAWLDAGWYGDKPFDAEGNNLWDNEVGNWYPNAKNFGKDGIQRLSKAVHDSGYRFILWYEPERAKPNSQAAKENRKLFYDYVGPGGLLLRLDQEDAYQWMLKLISHGVEEYGMDIYRQDFNLNPLDYWLENERADRRGMTENAYINNLYRLMNELLTKYPHLVIDNCASGGRRLDIGMMRYCISIFRTDYSCLESCDPQGTQSHQQNILSWIPLNSAGIWGDLNDKYMLLSSMSVGTIISKGNSYAVRVVQDLMPYYRGNYYNLIGATYDLTSHQAWELFDPELGKGFAILIARPETAAGKLTVGLKGLEEDTVYRVYDYDSGETVLQASGRELMQKGVSLMMSPRSAELLMIEAVSSAVTEGETT